MRLVGERLAFGNPWVDLLTIPAALFLSLLVGSTTLGRLLLFPVQLQFHELGHAAAAWLSSRAALPLPFGFTMWREEPSLFTGACVVFLLAVLMVRALREARPFGAALAISLLGTFALVSLVMEVERARALIMLAGFAGELVLTCLVMVSFYFHLPDRLRWDFFRFVAIVPSTGAWLASVRLWLGVSFHHRPLPIGSILGGEGSGDIERLIGEHGFTEASLGALYTKLAFLTATILTVAYGAFAVRAVLRLRAAQGS